MMVARMLVSRLAPLLACLGLLAHLAGRGADAEYREFSDRA